MGRHGQEKATGASHVSDLSDDRNCCRGQRHFRGRRPRHSGGEAPRLALAAPLLAGTRRV